MTSIQLFHSLLEGDLDQTTLPTSLQRLDARKITSYPRLQQMVFICLIFPRSSAFRKTQPLSKPIRPSLTILFSSSCVLDAVVDLRKIYLRGSTVILIHITEFYFLQQLRSNLRLNANFSLKRKDIAPLAQGSRISTRTVAKIVQH